MFFEKATVTFMYQNALRSLRKAYTEQNILSAYLQPNIL